MKVTISERQFEYQPDYPDGWKFSAGDPFKFPVLIGDYHCFVKRIEQKSSKDIPGWDLMVSMTGKYEKNLARIYDIKNVQEDEKEIYYVFYEWLDGGTLDKKTNQQNINLSHLNEDLFNAVRSLQNYGYWFADFTEKNIFGQKDGSFVLVDLDSAQPLTQLPHNEMYGSKDYWVLVFKFFKEVLNKKDIRLSDLNGATLNYLQIPFLVLRFKQLLNGIETDYNSTEVFNQLPDQLIEMVPEFRDIYLNVAKNGRQSPDPEFITSIEEIVDRKIVKTESVPVIDRGPQLLPSIREFKTSSNEILSGGSFTLSWLVENANKLELHKNGALFKSLDNDQNQLVLKEFADGTRQESFYQLYAYRDLDMAKSGTVTVKLKDEEQAPRRSRKVVWIILGLLAIGALSFFLYPQFTRGSTEFHIRQQVLLQGMDSTLTIYGTDLSANDAISVDLNDTAGEILSVASDSLVLLLPTGHFSDSNDVVRVKINLNNQSYDAGTFTYLPKVELRRKELYEDAELSLFGSNLNTKNIKVLFGNKQAAVVLGSDSGLIVTVPKLDDPIPGNSITLQVTKNEHTILSTDFAVKSDTIKFQELAPDAMWIRGEVVNGKAGNDGNLPWQGELTDGEGYARLDDVTMEDGVSHRVLRTHPKWIPNGTIRGFFKLMEIYGKKTFNARVGFVENGRSIDGVIFQVWVYYSENNQDQSANIIRELKMYDGQMKTVRADLPDKVKEFSIELRVDAGNRSESDWAGWVDPILISRKLVAAAP
jgi:hypothetical protein